MLDEHAIQTTFICAEEPSSPWSLVIRATFQTFVCSSDCSLSRKFSCLCCTHSKKLLCVILKTCPGHSSLSTSREVDSVRKNQSSAPPDTVLLLFRSSSLFVASHSGLRTCWTKKCKKMASFWQQICYSHHNQYDCNALDSAGKLLMQLQYPTRIKHHIAAPRIFSNDEDHEWNGFLHRPKRRTPTRCAWSSFDIENGLGDWKLWVSCLTICVWREGATIRWLCAIL